MNRKVLLIGLAVIAPLLVFLGVGLSKDPKQFDSPLVGKTAPPIALNDLGGTPWRLEALRGQPVVVNFWATWCQPCLWEHPILIDAARRYQGRAQFLGVILHDQPENVERLTAQRGTWGPSLVDLESKVAISYGVYGAPETFFIDRTGTIVHKETGPVTRDLLDRLLGPLL